MIDPASTLRAMSGIPTLAMRRAVLRERLDALDPAEAARLLQALVTRALAGHRGAADGSPVVCEAAARLVALGGGRPPGAP